MPASSRSGRVIVVLATLIFGAVGGYALNDVVEWLYSRGRPYVRSDVTSGEFSSFGVPFERPSSASSVTVAALGNGFGDVVTFAGIKLPPDDAVSLIESLKSNGAIWKSQLPRRPTYVDAAPAKLSVKLWPASGRAGLVMYEFKVGYLAHDPVSGELFMYNPLGGAP